MKKSLFLAAAALLAAGTLSAESLDIDGSFKKLNDKGFVARWHKNGAIKTTTYEVIRKEDGNILKLVSPKGYSAMYSYLHVPVKVGDSFQFKFKAKGKSSKFIFGYYAYDAKNKHAATESVYFPIDSPDKFTEYKGTITVKEPPADKSIAYIQFCFASYLAMDVEITGIEIEPVKK